MNTKQNIKMTFNCNQEWDTMKITERGRRCDLCKHEVFDFTSKTIAEINTIKKEKGEICGHFRIEQIEQGIQPIEFHLIKKTKYLAATLTTFLGLELTQANGQNKNETSTEIHSDSSIIIKENGSIAIPEDTTINCEVNTTNQLRAKKPFMTLTKRKYYWSKKIPFITTRRKNRIMGKF